MASNAGPAAKRAFYIQTMHFAPDEEGNLHTYEDVEAAEKWLGDMLTTLMAVGGTLVIQTDRVRVSEIGGEPIGGTAGLISQWTSQAGKMRDPAADRRENIEQTAAAEPAEEE